MPCVHPLPAWRDFKGAITIGHKANADQYSDVLKLPCGTCIGCRTSRAREWAVRCSLEEQAHEVTCWTTLTYEEKYKPPTLTKRHLQGWLKRLRARVAPAQVRFFASGEYGERFGRPHYHAILYGLSADNPAIQEAWPFGNTREYPITPPAISYIAGYTSKKVGIANRDLTTHFERVDPDTGEVYFYQPPFLQMSRRPGIAENVKKHWRSWRDCAITDGHKMPVPRFLHQAWLNNATEEEILNLNEEKRKRITSLETQGHYEMSRMEAREINAFAKQRMQAYERTLNS